jgi:hypothetical protein
MKFNLVVEIDDQYIDEYLAENPTVSLQELVGQLNNACYLGLDCTNAIIMRQFDMGICDTYVKKPMVADKSWGELWGDNFPTNDQCPIDVLDHHAETNNVIASDDVLNFGRAMWNEGNLAEKLS